MTWIPHRFPCDKPLEQIPTWMETPLAIGAESSLFLYICKLTPEVDIYLLLCSQNHFNLELIDITPRNFLNPDRQGRLVLVVEPSLAVDETLLGTRATPFDGPFPRTRRYSAENHILSLSHIFFACTACPYL